jgi:hypothetical protein
MLVLASQVEEKRIAWIITRHVVDQEKKGRGKEKEKEEEKMEIPNVDSAG